MDGAEIVTTVHSGQVPYDWNVWHLQRKRVLRGAAGWGALGIAGMLLLVPAALATIPSNYQHGDAAGVVTTIGLALLGTMAIGGLGLGCYDVWRVAHAADYLLIMTPEDFVMSRPHGLTHVPMRSIAHVTLRGAKSNEERLREDQVVTNSAARIGRLMGVGALYRRPNQSLSLAFEDTRSHRDVVVATDNAYDDIAVLEQMLSNYVFASQRKQTN